MCAILPDWRWRKLGEITAGKQGRNKMKATLSTPNTLFVALWTDGKNSAVVGSLRTDGGEMLPVLATTGDEPYATLAHCLDDVRAVAARHIVLYTNSAMVANTYRAPIRLEPTAPDRQHLYDPHKWSILSNLCRYASWQIVHTKNLPKAQQLWKESHANRVPAKSL
jgi:hypothetical protein